MDQSLGLEQMPDLPDTEQELRIIVRSTRNRMEVLVVRPKENVDPLIPLDVLPGGPVLPTESPIQAAVRTLR